MLLALLLPTAAEAEETPKQAPEEPAPKEAPEKPEEPPAKEQEAPAPEDAPKKTDEPPAKEAPAKKAEEPPAEEAPARKAPESDKPAKDSPAPEEAPADAPTKDQPADQPADPEQPSSKEPPAKEEAPEQDAPEPAEETAPAENDTPSEDTPAEGELEDGASPSKEAEEAPAGDDEEKATTEADEGDAAEARAPAPTPVPRTLYWRDSSRAGHRIAPDGRTLAWVETQDGESILRLAPIDDIEEPFAAVSLGDVVVTGLEWATRGPWLLANITPTGREAPVAVVIQTREAEVWRPFPDAEFSRWTRLSKKRPFEAVCAVGKGYPYYEGRLHIVNWRNRTRRRLSGAVPSAHVLDDNFRIRARWLATRAGAVLEVRRVRGRSSSYRKLGTFPGEHAMASEYLGASKDGEVHYLADTRTTNTAALVAVDENTAETSVLAHNPKASLTRVLWAKADRRPLAVQFDYDRPRWQVLDDSVEEDLERLDRLFKGAFDVLSRDDADRWWVLSVWSDQEPYAEYLYDRESGVCRRLSDDHPVPEARRTPLTFVEIPTRDGLTLPCNLALPRVAVKDAAEDGPHPLVLLVHGGPQSRTAWRYDPFVQILTDRGYAVLDVNFRGSTGFGVRFRQAARGEWGRRMQDDLLDAAAWAVKEGIADEGRIAVVGASYGGYATLMALAKSPDRFCCGIAMGPVVDLASFVERNEAAGRNVKDLGTSRTRAGRRNLLQRSPLNHAKALTKKPILLVHGLHDARLPHAETAELAKRIAKDEHALTFVTLTEEGHTLDRPETARTLAGLIETFLAQHMAGRRQPMERLASGQVRVELGGEELARLAAAPPATAAAEVGTAEGKPAHSGEKRVGSGLEAAR